MPGTKRALSKWQWWCGQRWGSRGGRVTKGPSLRPHKALQDSQMGRGNETNFLTERARPLIQCAGREAEARVQGGREGLRGRGSDQREAWSCLPRTLHL